MKIDWKHVLATAISLALTAFGFAAGGHNVVHWLALARHDVAGALNWQAVSGNLGASVWWVAIAAAVYPKLRKLVGAALSRHVAAHLAPLHEKIDLLSKAHADMHAKINDIVAAGPLVDPSKPTGTPSA